MIRTPAQHNTTSPAGQVVNPVGTLLKEIEEFKKQDKPNLATDTLKRNEKGNPA